MIPVSEATALIERNVAPLGNEKVPIGSAVGRILAEHIAADMDLPPFDRSQMDGFAVRAADVADAPVELTIVGESAAGKGWHGEMKRGEAVRIMTGARVPVGADTVQKVELTSEHDFAAAASQKTESTVTILEAIAADKNIVRQGDEIKSGERLFASGERINERMIATLAAFGYAEVNVTAAPHVSVLTTGSEVVEIDETPGIDQIRNSNSAMLSALIVTAGGQAELLPSAVDDLDAIKEVISSAAAASDMLVITGGVSVGKYDLTKSALVELGAEIFFDRVRLKPGKPAVFARLGNTIIFGLPGNPVSAAATFYLFVRKALLLMQRANVTDLASGFAMAGGSMKAAKERDTYIPVKLSFDNAASVTATPVKWIGSSDFIGFGRADAFAFVPGSQKVTAGETVLIFFL
jgi:molybdenum cofactor synthesis domain-containing protein